MIPGVWLPLELIQAYKKLNVVRCKDNKMVKTGKQGSEDNI